MSKRPVCGTTIDAERAFTVQYYKYWAEHNAECNSMQYADIHWKNAYLPELLMEAQVPEPSTRPSAAHTEVEAGVVILMLLLVK